MTQPIRYSIAPKDLAAHLFEVSVTVADPDPAGQRFALPVWIPGSYLVREFARNIVTLAAFNDAGRKVRIAKTDKNTWQAAPVSGALTLRYDVYAWDLSVRSAYLDEAGGFFNATAVFLSVAGRETHRARSTSRSRPARRSARGASARRCPRRAARGGTGSAPIARRTMTNWPTIRSRSANSRWRRSKRTACRTTS